jgi:hypothetical protein
MRKPYSILSVGIYSRSTQGLYLYEKGLELVPGALTTPYIAYDRSSDATQP